ncbi:hypothetical protein CON22_20785 [Bacillus cereus]|nr:hypothetical protein CON22_20785 [Bacillus cereus]
MKLIKKMLKSYSFLSLVIGLFICYINIIGQDSKNFIFFFAGCEPILYYLVYTEPFRSLMIDNLGQGITVLNIYAYILRVLTLLVYGVFFDCLRYSMQKYLTPKYVMFFQYLKRGILILVLIGILLLVLNCIFVIFFLKTIDTIS